MKYIRNFTKTVWGYAEVEASNIEEAKAIFDKGDFDEFDNESDYQFDNEISRK